MPGGNDRTRDPGTAEPTLLGEALTRAAAAAHDMLSPARETSHDLAATLHHIVAGVESVVRDGALPRITAPPTVPAIRAIEQLRRQFLRELRPVLGHVQPSTLLATLEALERLQEQLESSPAHPEPHGEALGGEALNLVLEIAHDLRSPATAILVLSEALGHGQSGPLTPTQQRQIALIHSAAFGLSALSNDLIATAHGRRLLDLHPIPFSVHDVLASVCDVVRPIADEKGLRIAYSSIEPATRIGYPLAVSRVLLNLATNAVNATASGEVHLDCRAVSADEVEFVVADTGPGIPREYQAYLFDAFPSEPDGGQHAFSIAGLGLSICRKLVEAMGGKLTVDSPAGRGTRFSFVLELPVASPA